RVRGLPRALHDFIRLRARLLQALTVFGQQLLGFAARAVGGVERLRDALATLVQRFGDARERVAAQDVERDRENDQRPDREADVGRDQPRVARRDGGGDGGEQLHRSRGRRR